MLTHMEQKSNRLINEKSPYLLQHAHNPVDWYSWSEEAFERAKAEDKPIFLSIGYSTCHWCHVMERESFEDEEVADILNRCFVSIKVDREERPDIDSIYMTFCQAYTGSGGWPLTIIMTPNKKPFFAGTYFPKESKYGHSGIIDLLNSIYDIWINDRKRVLDTSQELIEEIKKHTEIESNVKENIREDIAEITVKSLKQYFERDYGGFSRSPKFPTPHNIFFLLKYYESNKDREVLEMIEKTLESIYRGGIFDHIGQGFSRYSTDEKWLVPHFEKMLYDNALLSLVYVEAYRITEKSVYREIAEKINNYILDKMTSEIGGFYSAEDADSEGIEGKFYVWDIDEIKDILGEEKAKLFCETYNITQAGNFEGKNIPNLINKNIESLEEDKKIKNELEQIRKMLYDYREKRVHPFKDDKILTSWNGLAIAAFAYGGKILGNREYIDVAEKAADFILRELIIKDNRLFGRYREGEVANLGVLEDYAFLVWGLIELFEANLKNNYLYKAIELNEQMIKLFYDEQYGGLYLYGSDSEQLIIRPKELYDGAIPSGNSVATLNIIRLARLTNNKNLRNIIQNQFKAFGAVVNRSPIAYVHFITAYMYEFNLSKKYATK